MMSTLTTTRCLMDGSLTKKYKKEQKLFSTLQATRMKDLEENLKEPRVEIELEIDSRDAAEKQDAAFSLDYTSALVGVKDDINTPAFTIRAVLMGLVWGVSLGALNTFGSFRDISVSVPTTLASIASYPMGIFFAKVLPDATIFGLRLNPGPFSVKEHLLCYIIANSASGGGNNPYGLNNVVAQKLIFGDKSIGWLSSIAFVLVTQLLGFGVAGLFRRFLVRPTAMLWPGALAQVAFFNAFHETKELDDLNKGYSSRFSRYQMFWLAFGCMFAYSWIPSFFAPSLLFFATLCIIPGLPRNVRFLGSGSRGLGPGIAAATFDWTAINKLSLCYNPFWTTLNFAFGAFFFTWIVGPLLYATNPFNTPPLQSSMNWDGSPIANLAQWKNKSIAVDPVPVYNTNALFDAHGYVVKASQGNYPSLLDKKSNLNLTSYAMAGEKIFLSQPFALTYFCSFLALGALFTQVFLWYGKDVYIQFKQALAQKDDDLYAIDEHAKIMKNYADISEWMYLVYFFVLFIGAIFVCEFTPFYMQWWLTILCIFVGISFTLPVGIIQAITGYQPGLNILTQVISGFVVPGQTASVMAFKTMGYDMSIQSLGLALDLKLGHYMHVSPISMVGSQLLGTLVGAFVQTSVGLMICDARPEISDWKSPWQFVGYQTFANAGGIWGAIGPARFFGTSSPYFFLNMGYLIGFFLPFIPWILNKAYPSENWRKINIVLISGSCISSVVGAPQIYIVTPVLTAFFFQYYLYQYHRQFWNKFSFIIVAAFDSAAPLTVFLTQLLALFHIQAPIWQLNSETIPDWYCFDMSYKAE